MSVYFAGCGRCEGGWVRVWRFGAERFARCACWWRAHPPPATSTSKTRRRAVRRPTVDAKLLATGERD